MNIWIIKAVALKTHFVTAERLTYHYHKYLQVYDPMGAISAGPSAHGMP